MMPLAEYRQRQALLADWLPWAGLVAPGVVLNKDGSFQRTAKFRGPDLDSATPGELVATSARLNNALRRFGSGWALFVDAERRAAADYPESVFPDPLSWLVDEERAAAFAEAGSHFESTYHLTVAYLPPEETQARAAQLLIENTQEKNTHVGSDGKDPTHHVDWRERLYAFIAETERFMGLLEGVMPEIDWLNDDQTLTYLHACISTQRHRVVMPEVPMHLDAWLADAPLTGGLAPMLGSHHLRVASVRGFPTSTWPGLLDDLNRLGFAYRWSTRFLCLDKAEAERELTRLRRQWFAKRKNIAALLRETIFQQESPLVDTDAANKSGDADAALQELGSDQVAYGYVTATVIVLDIDPTGADEKLRAIERTIQSRGFVTIPETLNAVDAWLSSIPGHAYANVRQPIISTLNLAHMLPVSAVWAGPERNTHLDGPPLIVTRTDGATPFRLVTHIGDVGHTLVVGPTGMGKSVLLAVLAMQFRRYPGARIFAFDMGRSMRATILGLGGEHIDLGRDGAIAFQPLARIDDDGYRAWAADWIAGRLTHEGVNVGPAERAAVWSALGNLASAPVEQRTMTGLSVLLQSNALRQALAPYVLGGAHGKLLDADHDALGRADVQGFEMETLMHSKAAAVAVLHYLFARLEERFDGAPTLLMLDEAWLFLDDPVFAARIRQWLKTLRKKNVSVIFATQSLADIQSSSIAPAIIESCASRIFLPNPQASEPQLRSIYEGFGLNARQIDIVAQAQPKRDYYFQSQLGNRVFDLGLGSVAIAFSSASSPEDQRAIDAVLAAVSDLTTGPSTDFATAWLRRCGLRWAADLMTSFPAAVTASITASVAAVSGTPIGSMSSIHSTTSLSSASFLSEESPS
jgi:type IV secretion system protein VirB4